MKQSKKIVIEKLGKSNYVVMIFCHAKKYHTVFYTRKTLTDQEAFFEAHDVGIALNIALNKKNNIYYTNVHDAAQKFDCIVDELKSIDINEVQS